MKRTLGTLICFFLIIQAIPFTLVMGENFAIVINEACSDNVSGITDCNGEYSDWLELYNTSDVDIDIGGYGISDDNLVPMQYTFPTETVIPAKGRLLIFAAKTVGNETELHIGFKLSSTNGENVYLTDNMGILVDTLIIPALETDLSYGRNPDGSDTLTKMTPTPNAANDSAAVIITVDKPTFSEGSGFYDNNVSLELSSAEGTEIYYTTDGGIPKVGNANTSKYTEALSIVDRSHDENVLSVITGISANELKGTRCYFPQNPSCVDKMTVVRAIAVDDKGNSSDVVTNSYFVGYGNKIGYGVDVLSISSDYDNFFSSDKGIYVLGDTATDWLSRNSDKLATTDAYLIPANYNREGSDWERPVHIDFFDSKKEFVFGQDLGIRIHGNATTTMLQKGFNVYARSGYGSDVIEKPLFESGAGIKSFILRTGGNDGETSKLRDILAAELIESRNVATAESRPCQVFIDGEYWGMYNIQEKLTDHYIEEHYGIPNDNVVIIKNGEVDEGIATDAALYTELLNAANCDLTVEENYSRFCELVDIQSLIDYCSAELYFGNFDWPTNNYSLWRSREVGTHTNEDTKWRWVLYDVDQSMNFYHKEDNANFDTFSRNLNSIPIFSSAIKNADFKKQFVKTYTDFANTIFSNEYVSSVLDEKAKLFSAPMIKNGLRFISANYSEASFNSQTSLIFGFFEDRYKYMISGYQGDGGSYTDGFLKTNMGLSGNFVTLGLSVNDSNAGSVEVNTVTPEFTDNSWSGGYYTDYPISLTAKPANGYTFYRWELPSGGISTDASIEITLTGNTNVKAVFISSIDTVAGFSLYGGAEGESLSEYGSADEGYKVGFGASKAVSRIYSSITGTAGKKLEWSADFGETTPTIQASTKNLWGSNPYIELQTNTCGFSNLKFSAKLGGTKKAPRDWKLQYSLDGESFTDIENSTYTITANKTLEQAYNQFSMPTELCDKEKVYIRLTPASEYLISGATSFVGTSSGTTGVNDVILTGDLSADLEKIYTVSFDSCGGSDVSPQSVKGGEFATVPQNPTNGNLSLHGWYIDSDCSTAWNFETDIVYRDFTLYAKWVSADTRITSDEIDADYNTGILSLRKKYKYVDFISKLDFPENSVYYVSDANGTKITDGTVTDGMTLTVESEKDSGIIKVYSIVITNISMGKAVTASSSGTSDIAENMLDGDPTTRWTASGSAMPQTVEIDLGSVYGIDEIGIKWYGSGVRSYSYKLYAKCESGTYSMICDRSENAETDLVSDSFNDVSARYIKIEISGCSAQNGYASIYEVAVYGFKVSSEFEAASFDGKAITVVTDEKCIPKDKFLDSLSIEGNAVMDSYSSCTDIYDGFTLNIKDYSDTLVPIRVTLSAPGVPKVKSVTASSVQAGENAVANICDGNLATRWCASSINYPQNVVLDLGENCTVSGLDLYFFGYGENTRAYKYTVSVMADGEDTYSIVSDKSDNTDKSGHDILNFESVTARYIRIDISGSTLSNAWASICECSVLGVENAYVNPSSEDFDCGMKLADGKLYIINHSDDTFNANLYFAYINGDGRLESIEMRSLEITGEIIEQSLPEGEFNNVFLWTSAMTPLSKVLIP